MLPPQPQSNNLKGKLSDSQVNNPSKLHKVMVKEGYAHQPPPKNNSAVNEGVDKQKLSKFNSPITNATASTMQSVYTRDFQVKPFEYNINYNQTQLKPSFTPNQGHSDKKTSSFKVPNDRSTTLFQLNDFRGSTKPSISQQYFY